MRENFDDYQIRHRVIFLANGELSARRRDNLKYVLGSIAAVDGHIHPANLEKLNTVEFELISED